MNKEEILKKIFKDSAHILSPLLGGMMNESFVVESNNKKYVLYLPTTQANEMVDRFLEKENQDIVYKLGITSKNIYFNPNTGVKANEYIEGHSLDKVDAYDVNQVGELLKILHSSTTLSKKDYEPFKRFIVFENEALTFIGHHDEEYQLLRDILFSKRQFLESQEKVLAHNDSQKSNFIKGLDNRYYVIDFEFMMNNDPIYDIAAFGNNDVNEGEKLLKATYSMLNNNLYSRFYLWRIFLSLQWYNVALIKHHRGEGKVHNFNFLEVAAHFKRNALCAYKKYLDLN